MLDTIKPMTDLPAVAGYFGQRLLTYTTQLPAGALETILGHDPRSKFWKKLPDDLEYLYSHLQRATTKPRLDSLIQYIERRFIPKSIIVGAFPAISIGVQNPTEFQPYDDPSKGVGDLKFDLSRRNRRVVVDGLGRVSAVLQLVEWSESAEVPEETRVSLSDLLSAFTLPSVFFLPAPGTEPLTVEEMQQLFHDFNFRVVPVPARIAIALDHSDPYISLTNRIGKSDVIVGYGGMEMRSASLGKKSTAIVVQQNLLRFVRGATEGERFLEAHNRSELENPNLTEETLDDFEEGLTRYLKDVAEAMGEERFKDREALHVTSPGWGTLGILYHDLAVTLKVPDIGRAAQRIGTINWHRSQPEWSEIVREKIDRDGNTVLGLAAGGAQNRRFMTKKVREIIGIDSLLSERGAQIEAA